jgi:hypothetical protein
LLWPNVCNIFRSPCLHSDKFSRSKKTFFKGADVSCSMFWHVIIYQFLARFNTIKTVNIGVGRGVLLKVKWSHDMAISPSTIYGHSIVNWIQVRSTARHAIHLRFGISANALEIRAVQSPKCIVDLLLSVPNSI